VNAGKATHAGIELYLRHQWQAISTAHIKPWFTISLTNLAKAEFDSNVGEGAANVRGNRIPYAPKWLGDVGLGFESDSGLGGNLSVHYVSEQFGDARNSITPSADGTRGLIPAYSLINLSMTYQPKAEDWEIYINVHNLLDHQYISTRTDGLFAGPPRQALIGLRKNF
jgi:Fe(3+) dicitrate transport protein